MSVFDSSEKFEEVLVGFFKLIAATPLVADKLLASKLIIRFIYSDPDLILVVDCSGDTVDVRVNDNETKAIVEMSMKADIAHKFYPGLVE